MRQPVDLRTAIATFVVAFIAGGCVSIPRTPSPIGGPRGDAVVESRPVDTRGHHLVRVASRYIGTRYKYGGEDPRRGFDCSGLVFYSFDQLGVEVPRTAAEQRQAAKPVPRDALAPGDLLFFRTAARRADHVGIYAGDGKFIHAPRSGQVVTYGYLEDPYYRSHFVSAGRLP